MIGWIIPKMFFAKERQTKAKLLIIAGWKYMRLDLFLPKSSVVGVIHFGDPET
jgi:hypothetical protein